MEALLSKFSVSVRKFRIRIGPATSAQKKVILSSDSTRPCFMSERRNEIVQFSCVNRNSDLRSLADRSFNPRKRRHVHNNFPGVRTLFPSSIEKKKKWIPLKRDLIYASVLCNNFSSAITELTGNHIFMAAFWSWLIAQVAKFFTNCYRKGLWDYRVMFDSGGMPSSHTSLVFSLTTALAFQFGLGSAYFPLALAFSLIVAYDAAGVRRHAGKQAEVLNRILADTFHGSPLSDTKLKEVLGHSPLQVTCGAFLGIFVGAFYMMKIARI